MGCELSCCSLAQGLCGESSATSPLSQTGLPLLVELLQSFDVLAKILRKKPFSSERKDKAWDAVGAFWPGAARSMALFSKSSQI